LGWSAGRAVCVDSGVAPGVWWLWVMAVGGWCRRRHRVMVAVGDGHGVITSACRGRWRQRKPR